MALPIDKSSLKGKIVLAGVGNVLRGDDGFGPALVERLHGRVSFKVIDAGMAPENYLGVIIREKPDTIVFADTGVFDAPAGQVRFMSLHDVHDSSFFLTHNTSLKLLQQFIDARWTDADVFIVCVQPGGMVLGEGLSEEVEKQTDNIARWFVRRFPRGT